MFQKNDFRNSALFYRADMLWGKIAQIEFGTCQITEEYCLLAWTLLPEPAMKTLAALSATVLLFGLATPSAKAVSIYDASYDSSGNINNSIVTLDTFIVVGLYNGNTAFITDGSGYYARIYKSSIASYYVVGGQYSGVTVTGQAF